MYTLLKHHGVKKFLQAETPSLGASLLLSEFVFKFGSFTLECSAFLVTWYALGYVFSHALPNRKEALN